LKKDKGNVKGLFLNFGIHILQTSEAIHSLKIMRTMQPFSVKTLSGFNFICCKKRNRILLPFSIYILLSEVRD